LRIMYVQAAQPAMVRPAGSITMRSPTAQYQVQQAPVMYAGSPMAAVQYAQPGFGMVQMQPGVDPGLAQLHQRLSQLLQDHRALKQAVRECYTAVTVNADVPLDINGLQRLVQQIQARLGLPPSAFGNLRDTYQRFDFNGNGILDFNEGFRAVKRSMTDFRKTTGGDPPANVPTKSPEQAGYEVLKVLAAGGQGEAKLVRKVATGEELVLKTYSRQNENAGGLDDLLDEADHMNEVAKCEHVAHCLELFQDAQFLYMVSGANMGGDWSALKAKTTEAGVPMTEDFFKNIFKQALDGLVHLHRNAIMHCDLKEPNIMMADANYSQPKVVLIDLGLSQAFSVESQGPCGTPGYIPPETWSSGKWFPRGDMFSFAVVCFQLLADKVPDEKTGAAGIFTDGAQSMDDVIRITNTRQVPWQLMKINNPQLQHWLAGCLDKQILNRPRAPQVLENPWFGGQLAAVVQPARVSLTPMTYAAAPAMTYAAAPMQYAAAPVRTSAVYAAAPAVTYASAPPVQYAAAPGPTSPPLWWLPHYE